MKTFKQYLQESNYSGMTRSELELIDTDKLDKEAFGFNDGDIIEINPKDIVIKYHADLDNAEHKFQLYGERWLKSVSFEEPIQVSYGLNANGPEKFYLEDGHHRVFVALKLGLGKIKAEIVNIKINPINIILGTNQ